MRPGPITSDPQSHFLQARIAIKLALITPKGVFFCNDTLLSNFFKNFLSTADSVLMPTKYAYRFGGNQGLLVVAALTPADFNINFIDENHDHIDFDAHYDLVAISAMTQQATRAYEIADEFRRRGIKVVIGGIHATVLPEEAKEHADSVVIGEAENTWPEFINDFIHGDIRPFYKSASPVDLSKSPLPKYELLKKYDYKMIWVQTTRGCPRDCEFCCASNVYGRNYRRKTIGQVLYEINYIRSLWDEPVINFTDDNMFIDKAYSYELARKLGQMGLRWTAQTDISVADDNLFLELLQKNGCILLFIGFETLSKENRIDKHGWKQSKIEAYSAVIKKIQNLGIGILGSFIIGLDEDDDSTFEKLSDFIIGNRLYAAQITVLTPLPGTRLRTRLLKENRILTSDWKRYTFLDVNFTPQRMKPEEIQRGICDIYKQIYSKEARIAVIKHFKEIRSKLHECNPHLDATKDDYRSTIA